MVAWILCVAIGKSFFSALVFFGGRLYQTIGQILKCMSTRCRRMMMTLQMGKMQLPIAPTLSLLTLHHNSMTTNVQLLFFILEYLSSVFVELWRSISHSLSVGLSICMPLFVSVCCIHFAIEPNIVWCSVQPHGSRPNKWIGLTARKYQNKTIQNHWTQWKSHWSCTFGLLVWEMQNW